MLVDMKGLFACCRGGIAAVACHGSRPGVPCSAHNGALRDNSPQALGSKTYPQPLGRSQVAIVDAEGRGASCFGNMSISLEYCELNKCSLYHCQTRGSPICLCIYCFCWICSGLESIFYSLLSPMSFSIQGFDRIQAAKCEYNFNADATKKRLQENDLNIFHELFHECVSYS